MRASPVYAWLARRLGWGCANSLRLSEGVTRQYSYAHRFERGERIEAIEPIDRIAADALEAAGVEFTNGDQPGVRLGKTAIAHSAKSVSASRAIDHGEGSRRQVD